MADPLVLADARGRFARVTAPRGAIELVGESPAATRVQELVRRAAPLDGGVLITAESGVAADSIAYELHARSRRANGPYVIVECQTGDAARIDRLLFGAPDPTPHTDLEAVSAESRIATARGGTRFLRDVAELPAAVQAKLARIARDGEVRIDGAPVPLAWRLVATATPAVDADVQAHRFRVDLYRRLSTTRIDLPALRERAEDVPAIAMRLLDE